MKRLTLPAILVTAVLAFTLAGCSSGGQSMTDDALKGTWKLDSTSDVGFDAYASFGEDALFEMIVSDSYIDGEWSVSGAEGKVVTSDDHTVTLTYSNNKLTLGGKDGSKLVFVKDDSEEVADLFALDESQYDIQELQVVDEVITPIEPGVVVGDDATAAIMLTGKGTDFTGDPCYQLQITNKTDKTIYIGAEDDFTVGGKAVEAGLGDEITPGETLVTTMYFSQDDLGGGLEMLTTTDGIIIVYDNDTDDELAQYTFHAE